jgi:membrane dipeptidase
MRNLTDEQIRELAIRGGVIGMNGFNAFVSDTYEDGDLSHLIDHLDYIVNLVGTRHVGIGLDICNFLSEIPLKPAGHTRDSYDVIASHRDLPLFTEELIRRGYSDEEIGLIIGGNFLNLYKKILK